MMEYITRKSLLNESEVEYADYAINHVLGCAHGCKFPCYAFNMTKRFGRVKSYEDWIEPKLVGNAMDLLNKELPRKKDKIESVHLCFTTDPFMYEYEEISDLSVEIIKKLNTEDLKCTALTKGVLPIELADLSKINEYGITLVSLDEDFRKKYEPYTAPYEERIESLYRLHKAGVKTWVSIEPYPTPNIVDQKLQEILEKVSFVDKIVFGRLNYNAAVSDYTNYKEYYNKLSLKVINFCIKNSKEFHIKEGTISEELLEDL
jgi:DNA repair photolyase